MEQLAQFVTKSFEYNNNRVLDLLTMATRVDDDDSNGATKYSSKILNKINQEINQSDSDGDESEEIDITDESLPRHSPKIVNIVSTDGNQDSTNDKPECNDQSQSSPLSLVKKSTKGAPKNWLISDEDARRPTDENKRPQKGFFDALNLSKIADYSAHSMDVQFRAKPVTELLKEIRKFQNSTSPPLSTRLDDNYESRSCSPEQINQEGNIETTFYLISPMKKF